MRILLFDFVVSKLDPLLEVLNCHAPYQIDPKIAVCQIQ